MKCASINEVFSDIFTVDGDNIAEKLRFRQLHVRLDFILYAFIFLNAAIQIRSLSQTNFEFGYRLKCLTHLEGHTEAHAFKYFNCYQQRCFINGDGFSHLSHVKDNNILLLFDFSFAHLRVLTRRSCK